MDFRLNGHVMGQELAYVKKREVAVTVTGWDQVDRVELHPANPDYPVITIAPEDDFRIQGVTIGVIRNF